jgi:hypothetical protein
MSIHCNRKSKLAFHQVIRKKARHACTLLYVGSKSIGFLCALQPHFAMEMTFRTEMRSVSTTWPAAVVAEVVVAIDKETGNTRMSATAAPAAVNA